MPLRAEDISFTHGRRFRLHLPTVQVERGELLGVIGPNGAGKTTFLRILAGLLPPEGGSVTIDGEPLRDLPPRGRARRIAYVPQSHHPAFDYAVEEVVVMGRLPHRMGGGGFEREEDLAAADEAIALMQLDDLRHEPVTRLSGGELQRVMIARGIAQGSEYLLLDEPNAHLDVGHQYDVLATIREIAKGRRVGVIASIHDLNLASILCDRLLLLDHGGLAREGEPAAVLTPDAISTTFGASLLVEPGVYGRSPAVRYRATDE